MRLVAGQNHKRRIEMRGLIVAACLVFFALSSAQAREVAGVDVPEQISLGEQATPLMLNGAGLRKKFFLSIYLASLYLPERAGDAKSILSSNQANRVRMDMLYSEVSKEKLVKAWHEGFENNHSAEELAPLKARIETFNALFKTLLAGDRVEFDYLPATGTQVSINDVVQGVIPGEDFNRALLKIWLGEAPVTKSLKKDLLGG
jgi:hypothetical protein